MNIIICHFFYCCKPVFIQLTYKHAPSISVKLKQLMSEVRNFCVHCIQQFQTITLIMTSVPVLFSSLSKQPASNYAKFFSWASCWNAVVQSLKYECFFLCCVELYFSYNISCCEITEFRERGKITREVISYSACLFVFQEQSPTSLITNCATFPFRGRYGFFYSPISIELLRYYKNC